MKKTITAISVEGKWFLSQKDLIHALSKNGFHEASRAIEGMRVLGDAAKIVTPTKE